MLRTATIIQCNLEPTVAFCVFARGDQQHDARSHQGVQACHRAVFVAPFYVMEYLDGWVLTDSVIKKTGFFQIMPYGRLAYPVRKL